MLFLLNNYLMVYTILRHLYTKCFIKSKNHFSAMRQFLQDIFRKFHICISIPLIAHQCNLQRCIHTYNAFTKSVIEYFVEKKKYSIFTHVLFIFLGKFVWEISVRNVFSILIIHYNCCTDASHPYIVTIGMNVKYL